MHLFSTLFTAQSVDRDLRNEEGLQKAIAWCKASGLNKVYVESFRGGLFIEQELLEAVRDRVPGGGIPGTRLRDAHGAAQGFQQLGGRRLLLLSRHPGADEADLPAHGCGV